MQTSGWVELQDILCIVKLKTVLAGRLIPVKKLTYTKIKRRLSQHAAILSVLPLSFIICIHQIDRGLILLTGNPRTQKLTWAFDQLQLYGSSTNSMSFVIKFTEPASRGWNEINLNQHFTCCYGILPHMLFYHKLFKGLTYMHTCVVFVFKVHTCVIFVFQS